MVTKGLQEFCIRYWAKPLCGICWLRFSQHFLSINHLTDRKQCLMLNNRHNIRNFQNPASQTHLLLLQKIRRQKFKYFFFNGTEGVFSLFLCSLLDNVSCWCVVYLGCGSSIRGCGSSMDRVPDCSHAVSEFDPSLGQIRHPQPWRPSLEKRTRCPLNLR